MPTAPDSTRPADAEDPGPRTRPRAALLLGVIEAYGTIYSGAYLDRDAIAFVFLIAVLMVRPQGLFGARA